MQLQKNQCNHYHLLLEIPTTQPYFDLPTGDCNYNLMPPAYALLPTNILLGLDHWHQGDDATAFTIKVNVPPNWIVTRIPVYLAKIPLLLKKLDDKQQSLLSWTYQGLLKENQ